MLSFTSLAPRGYFLPPSMHPAPKNAAGQLPAPPSGSLPPVVHPQEILSPKPGGRNPNFSLPGNNLNLEVLNNPKSFHRKPKT